MSALPYRYLNQYTSYYPQYPYASLRSYFHRLTTPTIRTDTLTSSLKTFTIDTPFSLPSSLSMPTQLTQHCMLHVVSRILHCRMKALPYNSNVLQKFSGSVIALASNELLHFVCGDLWC